MVILEHEVIYLIVEKANQESSKEFLLHEVIPLVEFLVRENIIGIWYVFPSENVVEPILQRNYTGETMGGELIGLITDPKQGWCTCHSGAVCNSFYYRHVGELCRMGSSCAVYTEANHILCGYYDAIMKNGIFLYLEHKTPNNESELASRLKTVLPFIHNLVVRATKLSEPDETRLSGREQEVLGWVAQGKTNQDIARILNISVWTVKIHVANILKKLHADSRGHAVTKAYRIGLLY